MVDHPAAPLRPRLARAAGVAAEPVTDAIDLASPLTGKISDLHEFTFSGFASAIN